MAEYRGLVPAGELVLGDLIPHVGRILRLLVSGGSVSFNCMEYGKDDTVLGADQLVWVERTEAFVLAVRPLPIPRNRR